ncbi:MAG: hypothetical protein A2845_03645 [Candidatus Lloydbacteria bacterium RIFCSPHIGHO2_01_FULL_49_22]|uniref:Bacterial Ig-like domain-containing protein n=1 Tax=Candidatus Lloydbacteria bacterium RIFCSPHIGHO2_01_FULL_49_22 TaxID=1798658 RepID=A0A1G2CYW5_9BACT|nr:MAG: hypothetical protein A2845_03645 [Candidatus Lloydbacteria bacterium RIFCSPHIGHO2_01_FULL_49_22]OGZ09023.1 MAG: hypothetical protein A3C14_03480 [Candidatus Lloydbacteria bacterium RIFCSPHIGHO2_02_FULL_50_18]
MRRSPPNHFLIHTFAHLAAVFAILAVAVLMGVIGKTHGPQVGGMLAQTSGGTWVNLSATTTESPAVLTEVFFSAQPGPLARCDTGSPLTPVFFLVTKADGGDFLVSSDTGMNNAQIAWGEYPLPNGRYTWNASVKPGYVGAGALHGEFVIDNLCAPTETAVPPVSFGSGSSAIELPSLSSSTVKALSENTVSIFETKNPAITSAIARPQLRLFVDNKPVQTAMVFDRELLELRVTTAASAKVSVAAIDRSGSTTVLGFAEKDDLLSKVGVDVWTYEYDMKRSVPGIYKIFASMTGEDGKEILSERTSIEVRRVIHSDGAADALSYAPAATSESGTMTTSVRVSSEDKRAILDRVSDPSSCANEEECDIYCSNDIPEVHTQCLAYVRSPSAALPASVRSLVDGVDPARIIQMLGDRARRPKELSELINVPDEFKQHCADMTHADVCIKALVRNDMGRPETLLAMKEDIIRLREEEMKIFALRVGARSFIDSDNDGVTDYDEVTLYGTDPDRVDTDGDGFPDGAELLARTNPRGGERIIIATSSDVTGRNIVTDTERIFSDESIRLENPLIAGVPEPTLLSVRNVVVAELGTDEFGSTSIKKLKIEGFAPANSFVTVYVFSDPIVVTVKTDANGVWSHVLDRNISSGTHHVYGTINDANGRIIAKSAPLAFVKEATLVLSDQAPSATDANRNWRGASLYAMIAVVIGVLGVFLSIIGFILKRKEYPEFECSDIPFIRKTVVMLRRVHHGISGRFWSVVERHKK